MVNRTRTRGSFLFSFQKHTFQVVIKLIRVDHTLSREYKKRIGRLGDLVLKFPRYPFCAYRYRYNMSLNVLLPSYLFD